MEVLETTFIYLSIYLFVLQLYEWSETSVWSWHIRVKFSGTLERASKEQNVGFLSLLTLCGGCDIRIARKN